ncbi:hypothetical protein BH24ACI4_BH24ACI4_03960 [soil metagenome]
MHLPERQTREAGKGEVSTTDHGSVGAQSKTASERGAWRSEGAGPGEVVTLLARAVQQLHTYPASSTLCVSAIDATRQALLTSGCERVSFRVTPSTLILGDEPVGGPIVGRELARRLHRAAVASVVIERAASSRELSRFCEDLVRCGERGAAPMSLAERLAEHGIEHVVVELASRPEVLEVGELKPGMADALDRERSRFDEQFAQEAAMGHLYPPQKGWVRLDPSVRGPRVSLLDLAILAERPDALALMLLRLTDEAAGITPAEALGRKYSDVALLISALDPPVARRMLAGLARAVLDLNTESRQALLRRAVLPGLLEGRLDGAILRDFPDVDLAESLCLLLDLETAAPELLTTALSRLALSPDRQAAVVPLLDAQLEARQAAAQDEARQTTLVRHARELVRMDGSSARSFADYSAFDLSMDEQSATCLDEMRRVLPEGDELLDQLTCLWNLVCLEPNPDEASRFLARAFGLLDLLERESRGAELPKWLEQYRDLADRLRESRPDVADVVERSLADFCTPARAAWVVDISVREPGGREAAHAVITALGPSIAAPLVACLTREGGPRGNHGPRGQDTRVQAVLQLLEDHAVVLAPALVPMFDRSAPAVLRLLLRVMGSAGPGHEEAIAPYLSAAGEPIAREALRSLVRIGSPKAAGLVAEQIVKARGAMGLAAEETLWHFPAGEAQRHARALLARRDFTTAQPEAAGRLLDRAVSGGAADLRRVLPGLASMRFRIWNPALARVARKANTLLKASAS